MIGHKSDNREECDVRELERAVKSACNILGYADNSERRLLGKLLAKGYSRDAAEYALAYVIERGWLDEDKQTENLIHTLANSRLFGKRRIILELKKREFSREAIENADFSGIDFTEVCTRLYKKLGKGDGDKIKAALMRYGHSSSDISHVIRNFCDEDQ